MKNIKKIIIIIIVAIILLIVCIVMKDKIVYTLKVKKIENNLKNYLNLKSTEGMAEGCKFELERCKNGKIDEYDITDFVEVYLNQVNDTASKKEMNKVRMTNIYKQANDYSNYIKSRNLSMDEIITSLKNTLIYKNIDNENRWYIDKNSKTIIELPYNYYIKYTLSDRKDLKNIKEVLGIKVVDTVDFKNIKRNSQIYFCIKYKNFANQVFTTDKNEYAFIFEENGLIYKTLENIYYTETQFAKVELCNHDYDNAKKIEDDEELKTLIEMQKLLEELERDRDYLAEP